MEYSSDSFSKQRTVVLLAVIVIISSVLRLYKLSYQSLWIDEGATYFYSIDSLITILFRTEQTPPPFYIIEHFAYYSIGHSEFALRIVPVCFGIATTIAVYFLGKEYVSENAGIIAAFLLAISPFHIWFSQTARSYAIMLFFFVIFLIWFHRAYESETRKDWLITAVFATITTYFQFYTVVLIGCLGLLYLYKHRASIKNRDFTQIKNAITGFGTYLVLCIPLAILAHRNKGHIAHYSDEYADCWDSGLEFTYRVLYRIFFENLIPMIVLTIIVAVFVFIIVKYKKTVSMKILAFLSVVPLVVFTLMSLRLGMDTRYSFFLLPIYYLVVGGCILFLEGREKKIIAVCAVLCLATVFSAVELNEYYNTYCKADFRGAAQVLEADDEAGDVVIYLPNVWDTMCGPLSFYYDSEKNGTTLTSVWGIEQIEELISTTEGTVYLVVCYQNGWGVDQYKTWLDTNTTSIFDGYMISVFKCNV